MTSFGDVLGIANCRRSPGSSLGGHTPPAWKPPVDLGVLRRIYESLEKWNGEALCIDARQDVSPEDKSGRELLGQRVGRIPPTKRQGDGDCQMSDSNGSAPGEPAGPDEDGNAEYLDGQIRMLSEKLRARGLETKLVSYMIDGVRGKYYDAITVTNPSAPERGSMQIEKEGWMTWEYSGTVDDAGISNLADEAANALRATGVPCRTRPLP